MNKPKDISLEEFKNLPVDEQVRYFVSKVPIDEDRQRKLKNILGREKRVDKETKNK